MDANLITLAMQEAAATDVLFLTWCNVTYDGKTPTVQIGINVEDLPPQSDFPLVALSYAGKEGGTSEEFEELIYAVTFAIVDEAAPITTGNKKTYKQQIDLESGRQLLVKALAGVDFDGGYVSKVDVENDPLELFPIFSTNMAVTVTRPYVFREDKLV